MTSLAIAALSALAAFSSLAEQTNIIGNSKQYIHTRHQEDSHLIIYLLHNFSKKCKVDVTILLRYDLIAHFEIKPRT